MEKNIIDFIIDEIYEAEKLNLKPKEITLTKGEYFDLKLYARDLTNYYFGDYEYDAFRGIPLKINNNRAPEDSFLVTDG